MPKTGSTVIQASFHGLRRPDVEYLDAPGINHFGRLQLLYGAGARGRTGGPQDAPADPGSRARYVRARRTLDEQVARLRSADGTLVVSSEALWARERAALLRALCGDLAERGARVDGIAYLRSPLAQATSAFQQRLKHLDLPPQFGLDRVWPRFRGPLTLLEQSFGSDALELRPFRRGVPTFDVVADFASALGIPAPPRAKRDNPTLSAEATAVLYAARCRIPRVDMSPPGRRQAAAVLVERLRTLGRTRLSFAAGLWEPLAARHADDLSWAEARMGARLEDETAPDPLAISSEQQLLDLADAHATTDQAQAFNAGLDRLADRSAL